MKKISLFVAVALSGVILISFQNCGGYAALPSALSGTTASSANTTTPAPAVVDPNAAFLSMMVSVVGQVSPLLTQAGVSVTDLQVFANATSSPAALGAAAMNVLAALIQSEATLKTLTPAQMQTALALISSSVAQISSFPTTGLSAQSLAVQAQSLAAFQAVSGLVTAIVSPTSTMDNTAAFIQLLSTVAPQLTPALASLNISAADQAAISGAAIAAQSVTAAGVSQAVADITAAVASNSSLLASMPTAQKATYVAAINSAIQAMSLYSPATLSAQAQLVEQGQLSILNYISSALQPKSM